MAGRDAPPESSDYQALTISLGLKLVAIYVEGD